MVLYEAGIGKFIDQWVGSSVIDRMMRGKNPQGRAGGDSQKVEFLSGDEENGRVGGTFLIVTTVGRERIRSLWTP